MDHASRLRRSIAAGAAGAAAGLVGVAGVLAEDRHGLAGMMVRDPSGYIAFVLLVAAFTGTFAAAAFGGALWTDHGSPGGGDDSETF